MTKKTLTEVEIRQALLCSDEEVSDVNSTNQSNSDFDDDYTHDDDSTSVNDSEVSESSDEIELSDIEESISNATIYIGKDGTEWNSQPYATSKTPHNIIKGALNKVMLPQGKHIDSVADAFHFIFDEDVIKIIVECTNSYAVELRGENWKRTDAIEITAYTGILIEAGIRKNGVFDYKEFWDPIYGNLLIRASMSKNRFSELSRFLRFDEKNTRNNRKSQDKFAAIRDIFNIIVNNLKKYYMPGENLTIDEQLVPFRGRVSFRQYIPSNRINME